MKTLTFFLILLLSLNANAIDGEREPIQAIQEALKVDEVKGADPIHKRDFWNDFGISATIEEWNYKSRDEELELDWKLEIRLLDHRDIDFDASYLSHYDKQTDTFSKTTIREEERTYDLNYDWNRIWGSLGITTLQELNQIKENSIYEVKYDASIAIGLKYDFVENDTVTELSLSYLPVYNYLERYDQDEDVNGTLIQEKFIERSLQHAFRLNLALSLKGGAITLDNEIWWKEIKPFDDTIADQRDFLFSNEFQIQYNPNEYISLGYRNLIEVDERRKEEQELPSTDHQHSITFGLHWN